MLLKNKDCLWISYHSYGARSSLSIIPQKPLEAIDRYVSLSAFYGLKNCSSGRSKTLPKVSEPAASSGGISPKLCLKSGLILSSRRGGSNDYSRELPTASHTLHYTVHTDHLYKKQGVRNPVLFINLMFQMRKGGPGDADLCKMVASGKCQGRDLNSGHYYSHEFRASFLEKKKNHKITVQKLLLTQNRHKSDASTSSLQ